MFLHMLFLHMELLNNLLFLVTVMVGPLLCLVTVVVFSGHHKGG